MLRELPKVIIFDWDNTIIESWEMLHLCINHALKGLQLEEWSIEKVKESIHFSMRDFFPSLFKENAEKAVKLFREKYHDIKDQHLNYVKDVEKFLEYLFLKREQKQLFLAILSNKTGSHLRDDLTKLKILEKFDIVIGAGDCVEDKPSILPIKIIMDNLNIINPEQIWFIGDSIIDIECAHKAQCIPILFGDMSMNKERFNVYKPRYSFTNYNEFHKYVVGLKND